jgi:hypothetical protein
MRRCESLEAEVMVMKKILERCALCLLAILATASAWSDSTTFEVKGIKIGDTPPAYFACRGQSCSCGEGYGTTCPAEYSTYATRPVESMTVNNLDGRVSYVRIGVRGCGGNAVLAPLVDTYGSPAPDSTNDGSRAYHWEQGDVVFKYNEWEGPPPGCGVIMYSTSMLRSSAQRSLDQQKSDM